MSVKKYIGWAILGSLLVVGPIGTAIAKEKVRIGVAVSWPGYAFYELARANNMAPDYDLEITIYEDPIAGHNQLAAGNIDVYVSTLDYVPIAVENKLPIIGVAYTNPSYGVDQVVLAPGVSPQDVKGKKVAAPEAFIGQIIVGMWLEKNDIAPGDVTWVNLNADEGVGPMISGDIAAAYMYEPYTSTLVSNLEGTQIVASTLERDFGLGLLGDAIYMNADFISNNRKAALDMLRLRWDALKMWHDNTIEVNNFFAEYLKWPAEDIPYVMGDNGKFFKGGIYMLDFDESARYCGVLDGEPPFDLRNGEFTDAIKTTNEWWVKLGLMKSNQDPTAGFDCSLMGDLVKEGYRQSFSARM
ncbi:MAG: ABC transporter substrate-binding protein [bacterium]